MSKIQLDLEGHPVIIHRKGYCPHFQEVMELTHCYFCHFKYIEPTLEQWRKTL